MAEVSMKKKAEVLASMTYTRDKLGQIEKSVDTGFTEEAERKYEYDTKNRLTKSNGTIFEYDAANNVTKISPATYTYDKADQIATASNATFEYNKVGQRTKSTPTGGSATTFAYDQAGNLIKNVSGGVENTFKYDGTGLRSTETRGASTYPMVWDSTAGLPLLIRAGQNYYVYGPGGLVIEQITVGVATYHHHDQLGSTRILTNPKGEVTGTYQYGPNGAVWHHTGTQGTQMGWAGQFRMNSENQLIYLRARTYDPVTAQFLSRDPLEAVSGEAYTYAAANPVNITDATGLAAEPCGCPPPPCPSSQQSSEDPFVDALNGVKRDVAGSLLDGLNGKEVDPNKVPLGLSRDLLVSLDALLLEQAGDSGAAQTVRDVGRAADAVEWASFLNKVAGFVGASAEGTSGFLYTSGMFTQWGREYDSLASVFRARAQAQARAEAQARLYNQPPPGFPIQGGVFVGPWPP